MFSAQGRPPLSAQTTDSRSSGAIPAQAAAFTTVPATTPVCSHATPACAVATTTIAVAVARKAYLRTLARLLTRFSAESLVVEDWLARPDARRVFQVRVARIHAPGCSEIRCTPFEE